MRRLLNLRGLLTRLIEYAIDCEFDGMLFECAARAFDGAAGDVNHLLQVGGRDIAWHLGFGKRQLEFLFHSFELERGAGREWQERQEQEQGLAQGQAAGAAAAGAAAAR